MLKLVGFSVSILLIIIINMKGKNDEVNRATNNEEVIAWLKRRITELEDSGTWLR